LFLFCSAYNFVQAEMKTSSKVSQGIQLFD